MLGYIITSTVRMYNFNTLLPEETILTNIIFVYKFVNWLLINNNVSITSAYRYYTKLNSSSILIYYKITFCNHKLR